MRNGLAWWAALAGSGAALLLFFAPARTTSAAGTDANWRTFTVELPKVPAGAVVYDIVLLGDGTAGADHWGWPYDKAHLRGPHGRLQRPQSQTWIPVNDGCIAFAISPARSKMLVGIARTLTPEAPGSIHGKHGLSTFSVPWGAGHVRGSCDPICSPICRSLLSGPHSHPQ